MTTSQYQYQSRFGRSGKPARIPASNYRNHYRISSADSAHLSSTSPQPPGYAKSNTTTPRKLPPSRKLHCSSFPPSSFGSLPPSFNDTSDPEVAEANIRVHYMDWVQSLQSEEQQYTSLTVCCEVFLKHVLQATRHLETPNPLRTAVCCMLLDKITAVFDRYQPVLQPLKQELYASIYVDYEPRRQQQLAELELNDEHTSQSLGWYIGQSLQHEAWKACEKKFRKCEQQANQMEMNWKRQTRVLSRAIKTWQLMLLDRYFYAWRHHVRRGKRMDKFWCRKLFEKRQRYIMKSTFTAWRLQACVDHRDHHIDKLQDKVYRLTMDYEHLKTSEALATKRMNEVTTLRTREERVMMHAHAEAVRLEDELFQANKKIKDLEERVVEWRKLCGEILADRYGGIWTRPSPTSLLFTSPAVDPADRVVTPLFTVGTIGTETNPAVADTTKDSKKKGQQTHLRIVQDNVHRIQKQINGFNIRHSPPPEKVLLLWANNVIFSVHPTEPPAEEFDFDWKDGVKYVIMCRGLTGYDITKPLKDLNSITRIQWAIKRYNAWLQYNVGINSTDIANGVRDKNILLISMLFTRFCMGPPVDRTNVSVIHQVLDSTVSWKEIQTQWQERAATENQWKNLALDVNTHVQETIIAGPNDEAKLTREADQYILFHPYRILDILSACEETTGLSHEAMVADIKEALKTHVKELKRIFSFYATLDSADIEEGGAHVLSHNEFWRFCHDCKLSNKTNLRKTIVDRIFKKVNQNSIDIEKNNMNTMAVHTPILNHAADEGAAGLVALEAEFAYNPDSELTSIEWVEALVRIAWIKYSVGTIADKTYKLINEQIIPFACSSSVDEFRSVIYSKSVQRVIANHNLNLQKLFKHFGSLQENAETIMTKRDFLAVWQECKVLDTHFNAHASDDVFLVMQDREEGGTGLGAVAGPPSANSESTMVYREFLEAIVAVAIFKNPAPYIPVHDRCQHFLTKILFPNIIHHTKIRLRVMKV